MQYYKRSIRARLKYHIILSLLFMLVVAFGTASYSYADILPNDTVGDGISVSDARVSSPDIKAPRAFVMDDLGNPLFARNADEQCKIASVTKIMTAIVSTEFDSSLETTITVSDNADATPGSSSNALSGDTLPLSEALEGIMLPSGNDMAIAVSESIGRLMLVQDGREAGTITDEESEQRFVQAMNDKATELGMNNTLFANACGLDDGQYEGDHHSTARDVAKMVAYAMKNDSIRKIVAEQSSNMTVERNGEQIDIPENNTNRALSDDKFNGVKTGFTDYAGACLASSYKTDDDINGDGKNDEIYVVVLGEDSYDDMYEDTFKIADWENSSKISVDLCGDQKGTAIGQCVHTEWSDKSFAIGIANDDSSGIKTLYSWEFSNIEQQADFYKIQGDISAGDEVGMLTYSYDGKDIANIHIVAMEDMKAPNILDKFFKLVKELFDGITGSNENSSETMQSFIEVTPIVLDE